MQKQPVLPRRPALVLLGLATVICALTAGCSRNRNPLDVLPNEDKARATLEKTLAAWKGGQPYGKITGESPAIEVVDNRWQAGNKLASFEILQTVEKPGTPGPRWFAVKLTLQDSAQPKEIHYAVMGLDPLWVMPEEDYEKTCGMGKGE
ncbi:MAG TPA: hypothetical protein VKE98_19160 [Gemmataceae bacterium]|nr:hypothetical protein [Gemmataceae bacterium]